MDPSTKNERKAAVKEHRQTVLSATKGEEQLATVRKRFRSKKKHFVCPLTLRNRLPDPVPGPKLLALPMELQSLVEFKPTSLDLEYKWRHHCERTLGVHIDLVDLDAHSPDPDKGKKLHPDDDRLLKWDALKHSAASSTARSERSFLRKTVFMHNDLSRSSALQRKEAKRDRAAQEADDDGDSSLAAAVASFEVAGSKGAETLVHPTKPGVTCVWSLPVVPDHALWPNDYRLAEFEDAKAAKRARLEHSLIVNTKNEFVPKLQASVLTGSLIVPTSGPASDPASVPASDPASDLASDPKGEGAARPHEWVQQYRLALERGDDRGDVLLCVDPASGVATFKHLAPQKLELRGGLPTSTSKREEELDKYEVKRYSAAQGEDDGAAALSDDDSKDDDALGDAGNDSREGGDGEEETSEGGAAGDAEESAATGQDAADPAEGDGQSDVPDRAIDGEQDGAEDGGASPKDQTLDQGGNDGEAEAEAEPMEDSDDGGLSDA